MDPTDLIGVTPSVSRQMDANLDPAGSMFNEPFTSGSLQSFLPKKEEEFEPEKVRQIHTEPSPEGRAK